MSEDLVVQTNGPYLRVVLPDFDPDWAEVWGAVDFELEEGIERAEVIRPAIPTSTALGSFAKWSSIWCDSMWDGRPVAGPASRRGPREGVVGSQGVLGRS